MNFAKGGEIYFSPFEENIGWTGQQWQYSDAPILYDNTKSITGRSAGKIVNTTTSEKYSHSDYWLQINNTQPTKYKISGWIYSTKPTADIYLFMKTASATGYFTLVDQVSTNTGDINKWVYVEKVISVPANITKLNIRLDNNGASNGGGTVWFDDIRVHPDVAFMTTYTYDPLIGMTSQTDPNNRRSHFTYDEFGRLYLVLDHDKNILKKYCYNYQGQIEDCSLGCTTTISNWQNTTTPIRCKVNSAGQNTGEQEREQKDLNPCSSTFNQLKWVVIGTNNSACPIATQTIYAVLSYENSYSDFGTEYADIVVRFYSDGACTTPINVTNLTVNYSRQGHDGYSTFNTNESIIVSGYEQIIQLGAIMSNNNVTPPTYQDYYLQPGNYSIIY